MASYYQSASFDDNAKPTQVIVVDARGGRHVYEVKKKTRRLFHVSLPFPQDETEEENEADEELQRLVRSLFKAFRKELDLDRQLATLPKL